MDLEECNGCEAKSITDNPCLTVLGKVDCAMPFRGRGENAEFERAFKLSPPFFSPSILQLETMEPKLIHVFTVRARAAQDSVYLGPHPTGFQKHIKALEGGDLRGIPNTRGEGMDATLVPGGSDWVLFDPATNVAQIDVRTQSKLSDGSGVSVQYTRYLW